MSRRMYRYVVPVDDAPTRLRLTGDPVAVAAIDIDGVEFWAEHDDDAGELERSFQVFGTGQELPDGAKWVGTCQRVSGLVWHLYERTIL